MNTVESAYAASASQTVSRVRNSPVLMCFWRPCRDAMVSFNPAGLPKAWASPQNLPLRHIPRHVQQLDLVDRLELRVVGLAPDDLLLRRDLEDLRLLAEM